jgi:hypothetical protein
VARKRTRAQNQAKHWEDRQLAARADGPPAVAAVWFDASRMVANQRALHGDEQVWEELAKTLKDFYTRYSQ